MNYPADVDSMVALAQQSEWDWEELEREILGCWPTGPILGGDGWSPEELAKIKANFES